MDTSRITDNANSLFGVMIGLMVQIFETSTKHIYLFRLTNFVQLVRQFHDIILRTLLATTTGNATRLHTPSRVIFTAGSSTPLALRDTVLPLRWCQYQIVDSASTTDAPSST